jgi:hypothetical protein
MGAKKEAVDSEKAKLEWEQKKEAIDREQTKRS